MLRIEIDVREWERRIARLAGAVQDLTPVARDFGGHVIGRWKRLMPSQMEPSYSGEPPASHHRGRGLAGSLTYNILPHGEGVEMGTPLVYGGVLHFGTQGYLGGPIRPRTAKALAIPLNDARGRRPKDYKRLRWRPNRRETAGPHKRGVLGQMRGGRFVPLFALQTEVEIEPRPWAEILAGDEKYLADRLEERLDKEAFGR